VIIPIPRRLCALPFRRANSSAILPPHCPKPTTTSFISQVERAIVSPSVDSLKKITQALGIGIGDLFEEDSKEFTFIRKDKALKITDEKTKSSCEILVSDLLGIKMNPLVFRLQKNGEIKKELLLKEGDTFGMVMEGNVNLIFPQKSGHNEELVLV